MAPSQILLTFCYIPQPSHARGLLDLIAAVPTSTMSLKLTMKGRLLIRRFELESIIIDGVLQRFKDPQLVIKPELDPGSREFSTGPRSGDRPRPRRQVLMVHVKDKATELEKVYLDTFLSSSGTTDTTQRNSVTCSRMECSLVFRYSKEDAPERPRTLMVRFRASADLDAAMDELKTSGIQVENSSVESQGGTRMAVHPQLQHLVVVDQTTRHLPLVSQQPYYPVSSPLGMSPGFTPPPAVLHHSGVLRPTSNPGAPFYGVQPAMQSWTPPPRPATTTGIPGIMGEGIYKISRVGSSCSNRSRGRRLPTISESQDRSDQTVSRHFSRAGSFSTRPSLEGRSSQASQTNSRKARLARLLSQKYSNTGRLLSAPEGVPPNGSSLLSESTIPEEPETSARTTFSLGSTEPRTTDVPRGSEFSTTPRSTLSLTDVGEIVKRSQRNFGGGSTEPAITEIRRDEDLYSTQSTLNLTDLEEVVKNSQSETSTLPPSTGKGSLLREFMLMQEGLTATAKIWNELMERGQTETEGIDDLEKVHQIWVRLGREWDRQLQSRLAVTLVKLRELRGETGS
ncbi:hypothetical protein V8F20_002185 [Naviculisporaceae sp. PSN 640]